MLDDDEFATRFVEDGFVRLPRAFPRRVADEGRALLWRATGCDPDDRATWTRPAVRIDHRTDAPFREAANTPELRAAFDLLVGPGRWLPRMSLGTFPIRFPSALDADDGGWHVDAGFYGADGSMRLNVASQGRVLLMLFLFSDVGPDDAPTRIRVGSHLAVPRLLAPAGAAGLTYLELAERLEPDDGRLAVATGEAGDVYLCHPFLVHAAQPHRGTTPRFLAQPPLQPAQPLRLEPGAGPFSPVELAVRRALGAADERDRHA